MKIGYFAPFGNNPMAELETRIRFRYCTEKLGFDFYELDTEGFDIETGKHAESLDIDFIFSHDTGVDWWKPLPDIYSCFAHWSPNGFIIREGFESYFAWMSKYDVVTGGYESKKIQQAIENHPDVYFDPLKITSSISKDFIKAVEKKDTYKLFYVGINLEKIQKAKTRYLDMIKYLDDIDLIDIYGPNECLGVKNIWEGFKNYKGEIPFDGYSIIDKISESGISLALNSPIHNYNDTVSNRIYEAAAAGAVIISDDNKYVRQYFGDSIFYIDVNLSEKEQITEICNIVSFIKKNPDRAYDMAKNAQEIFLHKLSLDQQVLDWFIFMEKNRSRTLEEKKLVDVICFLESIDDFVEINRELEKQYYKKLRIIVCLDQKEFERRDELVSTLDFIVIEKKCDKYGEIMKKVIPVMKGDFFIFMNRYVALHKNHVNKLVSSLEKRNNDFVYSGTYIKYIKENGDVKKYETCSCLPLSVDEFCAFRNMSAISENQLFDIEERFSLSCCMFKKEILSNVVLHELVQINKAVHFYLACSSIIKNNKTGHFIHAISSGYKIPDQKTVPSHVFKNERNYYEKYHRTEQTFFKDLFLVFFKYDFNVRPLPAYYEPQFDENEKLILEYLKINRFAWKFINCVTFYIKRKYSNRNERYINFLRKHKFFYRIYWNLTQKSLKEV